MLTLFYFLSDTVNLETKLNFESTQYYKKIYIQIDSNKEQNTTTTTKTYQIQKTNKQKTNSINSISFLLNCIGFI